jgi:hypothetical protein
MGGGYTGARVGMAAINNVEKRGIMGTKDKYVIVRTYAMGVFAGELDAQESTETKKVLKNARRLWYWDGAASLSELATRGTSKPKTCKFPAEVPRVELTSPNGFEVLDVSDQARESIGGVAVWTQ